MLGVNKVYLVGHLGGDPQAQTAKSGKGFIRLNLATNRSRKKESGGFEKICDWHNVTVWGRQGEACLQYLKKGSKVMIEGYLSHYEGTDKNGEARKYSGVTAHTVEFFDRTASAA